MKSTISNRLNRWTPRRINPAIRERLFEERQRKEGPWVYAGLLRALVPVTASILLTAGAMHDVPAPARDTVLELDTARLASTNEASAGLLSLVPPSTLEWNRLALATLASTNPIRSFSSNGSFWALSTNIFVR